MRMVTIDAVIELEESLAVSCGAAHVGKDQRHAELVQIEIVSAQKSRTVLPLRATVNIHHHRPLAGKLCCVRHIKEAGNCLAIEGWPFDELRFGEGCRVQATGF